MVPVKCRVVAATKEDLLEKSREGSFRSDLYYRLNVVNIHLPPLRERREDIPMLMTHFTLLAAERFQRPPPDIDTAQMSRLMAHDWPGNVRELRNVADCLVLGVHNVVLGETAKGAAGPAPSQALSEAVERFERELIQAELQRQGGNVARCAEALKVAKTTLHDKIKRFGLQP